MRTVTYILCLLICSVQILLSQQYKIDSINKLIPFLGPIEQVKALNHIPQYCWLYDTDSIKFYSDRALNLAVKIGNKDEEFYALCNLFWYYLYVGNNVECKQTIEKAENLLKEIKNIRYLGFFYLSKGINCSFNNNDYDRFYEWVQKALKIGEDFKDYFVIGNSYYNIGYIYDRMNNPDKGIEYHKKALVFFYLDNNIVGQCAALEGISEFYSRKKMFDSAYVYSEMNLHIQQKFNLRVWKSYSYYVSGLIFEGLGKYKEAIQAYKEAIKYDEINNSNINFTSCLLYTSPSPRDRTRSRMPSSA